VTDNDSEVRLVAVETLERLGKAPDEATIKAALTRPKATGGLFGLASQGHPDDSSYVKLKLLRLCKLGFDELRAAGQKSGVFDYLRSQLSIRATRAETCRIDLRSISIANLPLWCCNFQKTPHL
jgi:hypothetical protein